MIALVFAVIKALIIWILEIAVGVVACAASIYLAIHIFDKTTAHLEEWKELKKGNIAVGILLGGVVFSVMAIIIPAVTNLLHGMFNEELMKHPKSLVIVVIIDTLNLLLSMLVATLAVAFTFKLIDHVTRDIEEEKEIQKGNIAVATLTAIVLVASAMLIREVVEHILLSINGEVVLSLINTLI